MADSELTLLDIQKLRDAHRQLVEAKDSRAEDLKQYIESVEKAQTRGVPTRVNPPGGRGWQPGAGEAGSAYEETQQPGDWPGIVTDPSRVWDVIRAIGNIPRQSLGELSRSGQAMWNLDPAGAFYHLQGVDPVFGSLKQQIINDIAAGKWKRALGHGAGLVTNVAASLPAVESLIAGKPSWQQIRQIDPRQIPKVAAKTAATKASQAADVVKTAVKGPIDIGKGAVQYMKERPPSSSGRWVGGMTGLLTGGGTPATVADFLNLAERGGFGAIAGGRAPQVPGALWSGLKDAMRIEPVVSPSLVNTTASMYQGVQPSTGIRLPQVPVPAGAAPGAWEMGLGGQVVEKPTGPTQPFSITAEHQPVLRQVPAGTKLPPPRPGPVPMGTGLPVEGTPQLPWWDPMSQTWQEGTQTAPLTKPTLKPGPVPVGTGIPSELPKPPEWWESGGDWQGGTQTAPLVQPPLKGGPVPVGTGIPTELPKPPQWWEPGGSAEFPGTQTVTPSNKITAQPGFVPQGTGLPVAAPKLKDAAQQAAVDRAVKETGFTGPKPLPTLEEIKAHTPEQWEPHYQEMLKRVEEEGGHGKHGTDRVRVARNKDYGIAEYLKEQEKMSVDKWEGLTEAQANEYIDKLNKFRDVKYGGKGSYKYFGSNEKAGTGRSSAVGRDHVGKALRVLYGE
jgi:hypothetical protein